MNQQDQPFGDLPETPADRDQRIAEERVQAETAAALLAPLKVEMRAMQEREGEAHRAEGAIDALRAAAEEMRVGVAVGPVPLEVRPAVAAWLCRLAQQRRDRLAQRTT
ncbi:hypothetical protein [Streptomyces sp. NPDC059916]|uniref:hypothetical protein n=1 Tax=Streptomyces sp. NPDC059916 TaxID=3347001 RepID=UPI0036A84A3F